MSDHFLVEARLKLVGWWKSARRMWEMCWRWVNCIIVYKQEHTRKLAWKIWSVERWGGQDCWEGVWKVKRYCNGVYQWRCGIGCLGGHRRKWSECWNEDVGEVVVEKRWAFEKWLQRRDRLTYIWQIPGTESGRETVNINGQYAYQLTAKSHVFC